MTRSLILVLLLLLGAGAGRAEVFDVSGTLYQGFPDGTLSGTETIDTVNGVLTGADITMIVPEGTFVFTLADLIQSGNALSPTCVPPFTNPPGYACDYYVQIFRTAAGAYANLAFDANATLGLVGYQGSGFCGTPTANCYTGFDYDDTTDTPNFDLYYVGTGGLSPAATQPTTATPEPTGLVLLGTGALGGVAAMRRRLEVLSR